MGHIGFATFAVAMGLGQILLVSIGPPTAMRGGAR